MLSMSRKKVFLLVVSLVLMMGLFSNVASAQEGGIGEGLGSAFDTIRQLFAFLPDLITLEGLLGEEPAAIFWAKFLVWLFLFAVVYFGASAIPGMKESKNIAIVIAIVISLMGALLIPNDILVNIFQTYGLLAGIIIWIIPVAAGMFIAHKVTLPFFRALVYGTAAWILWSINATVVDKMGFANTSFPYFGLLFAVVVIMFFWNLFAIFGGGQGQAAVGGWFGDRGRDIGDWATRDRSGDRGLLGGVRRRDEEGLNEEERRARELTRREQGLLARLINSNIRSLKTDTQIKDFIQKLRNFVNNPQFLARKMEVLQKLEQLLQYITGRETAEDNISKILKKNKNLLGRIYKTLRGMSGYTEKKLRDELRSNLGRRHAEVTAELLKEEGKAKRADTIETYLNKVVIGDEKKRKKLFGDVKRKLQDVINAVRKAQPNLETIESALDDTIKRLDQLIMVDGDIQRREMEMYRENKFLEHILSITPPDRGGTGPRR